MMDDKCIFSGDRSHAMWSAVNAQPLTFEDVREALYRFGCGCQELETRVAMLELPPPEPAGEVGIVGPNAAVVTQVAILRRQRDEAVAARGKAEEERDFARQAHDDVAASRDALAREIHRMSIGATDLVVAKQKAEFQRDEAQAANEAKDVALALVAGVHGQLLGFQGGLDILNTHGEKLDCTLVNDLHLAAMNALAPDCGAAYAKRLAAAEEHADTAHAAWAKLLRAVAELDPVILDDFDTSDEEFTNVYDPHVGLQRIAKRLKDAEEERDEAVRRTQAANVEINDLAECVGLGRPPIARGFVLVAVQALQAAITSLTRRGEAVEGLVEAATPLVGLTQFLHGWVAAARNNGAFGDDEVALHAEASDLVGDLEERHHALTAALRPFAASRPDEQGAPPAKARSECAGPGRCNEARLCRHCRAAGEQGAPPDEQGETVSRESVGVGACVVLEPEGEHYGPCHKCVEAITEPSTVSELGVYAIGADGSCVHITGCKLGGDTHNCPLQGESGRDDG